MKMCFKTNQEGNILLLASPTILLLVSSTLASPTLTVTSLASPTHTVTAADIFQCHCCWHLPLSLLLAYLTVTVAGISHLLLVASPVLSLAFLFLTVTVAGISHSYCRWHLPPTLTVTGISHLQQLASPTYCRWHLPITTAGIAHSNCYCRWHLPLLLSLASLTLTVTVTGISLSTVAGISHCYCFECTVLQGSNPCFEDHHLTSILIKYNTLEHITLSVSPPVPSQNLQLLAQNKSCYIRPVQKDLDPLPLEDDPSKTSVSYSGCYRIHVVQLQTTDLQMHTICIVRI